MTKDPRSLVRRTAFPRSASTPVATPIYPSVVYRSNSPSDLDAIYEGQEDGYAYSREGHPNADVLAKKIDWMEEVKGGVITCSGMAAVTAALLSVLKSGDHIIAGDQLYGRSLVQLKNVLPRFGIETSFADPTDGVLVRAAITDRTKAILVEVVSNPTLRLADMPAIIEIAKKNGLLLIVDNTFTTPNGFKPIVEGADIVVHSVTKILAGHSDVMLGYVAGRDPVIRQKIRDIATTFGLSPSPYECWLAERGLYSFDLRFQRSQENAAALADCLAEQPGIAQVLYPGRPDHPDHNRAVSILGDNHGNMVSFILKGGRESADKLTLAAPNIAFAPTLGDIGTVLSHPASSSHRAISEEARTALGITEGFFRVSVGIEDIEQLKAEFTHAISKAV